MKTLTQTHTLHFIWIFVSLYLIPFIYYTNLQVERMMNTYHHDNLCIAGMKLYGFLMLILKSQLKLHRVEFPWIPSVVP